MKNHAGVHVHTITQSDIGKRMITYTCQECGGKCCRPRIINTIDLMGGIQACDVGKCIHWVNPDDEGCRIYQVENDEQLANRLAGKCGCRGVRPCIR